MTGIVRIFVESLDHEILDCAIKLIVSKSKRCGARFKGPILLATEVDTYIVLRNSIKKKRKKEIFNIRTHRRMIDVMTPTPEIISELSTLTLPVAVNIKIRYFDDKK